MVGFKFFNERRFLTDGKLRPAVVNCNDLQTVSQLVTAQYIHAGPSFFRTGSSIGVYICICGFDKITQNRDLCTRLYLHRNKRPQDSQVFGVVSLNIAIVRLSWYLDSQVRRIQLFIHFKISPHRMNPYTALMLKSKFCTPHLSNSIFIKTQWLVICNVIYHSIWDKQFTYYVFARIREVG